MQRYRCVLKGHPGPFVEEGILGWEVYRIDRDGLGTVERLIGMYFAHRDRLELTSPWPSPMPDIAAVLRLPQHAE